MSAPSGTTATASITARQAAFIGIAAMVGAGIFALLGEAGAVAGAAVWLSFLIAGGIAMLQGYSFAKLGSKFPSAGGLLEYIARGFGDGHITGMMAWIVFASNIIVTALVAVSFGNYASAMFADGNATWAKVFAGVILLACLLLNLAGGKTVARVQGVVVKVVIGILAFFAVVTVINMDPSLLAPSNYPGWREIISSVALTFFAFLGFGVVSFTAKDLADPSHELPKAMYLALGVATVIYVGVALGVFGTLTPKEVIDSGGTAIAVAAEPYLGRLGYWLMAVTAVFATAGATNSGIYPVAGISKQLAATRQFPPLMAREVGRRRAPIGLLIMVGVTLVMALAFDLGAIASLGSAVALGIFSLVTIGHIRIRSTTGAKLFALLIGVLTTVGTFVVFAMTSLDQGSTIALIVTVLLAIALDLTWKRILHRRETAAPTGVPTEMAA